MTFKVGDKVRCIEPAIGLGKTVLGKEFTISKVTKKFVYVGDNTYGWYHSRFELVKEEEKMTTPKAKPVARKAKTTTTSPKPTEFKLEAGKWYVSRNGAWHGYCVGLSEDGERYYLEHFFISHGIRADIPSSITFRYLDGRCYEDGPFSSDYVKEYTPPPPEDWRYVYRLKNGRICCSKIGWSKAEYAEEAAKLADKVFIKAVRVDA